MTAEQIAGVGPAVPQVGTVVGVELKTVAAVTHVLRKRARKCRGPSVRWISSLREPAEAPGQLAKARLQPESEGLSRSG